MSQLIVIAAVTYSVRPDLHHTPDRAPVKLSSQIYSFGRYQILFLKICLHSREDDQGGHHADVGRCQGEAGAGLLANLLPVKLAQQTLEKLCIHNA